MNESRIRIEVLERDGVRIVECVGAIDEALDLVADCLEKGVGRVLLEARRLPPAFFDLRTGFAGELLQKLENYQLRAAGVFPPAGEYGDRFREFLSEARRGRSFRAFATRAEAEAWLVSG